jgi:hypothetical protein
MARASRRANRRPRDDLQARGAFDLHQPLIQSVADGMALTLAQAGLLFDASPRS